MNFQDLHILGELKEELLYRILYSTDASAYREMPIAVAYPKDSSCLLYTSDAADEL